MYMMNMVKNGFGSAAIKCAKMTDLTCNPHKKAICIAGLSCKPYNSSTVSFLSSLDASFTVRLPLQHLHMCSKNTLFTFGSSLSALMGTANRFVLFGSMTLLCKSLLTRCFVKQAWIRCC